MCACVSVCVCFMYLYTELCNDIITVKRFYVQFNWIIKDLYLPSISQELMKTSDRQRNNKEEEQKHDRSVQTDDNTFNNLDKVQRSSMSFSRVLELQ